MTSSDKNLTPSLHLNYLIKNTLNYSMFRYYKSQANDTNFVIKNQPKKLFIKISRPIAIKITPPNILALEASLVPNVLPRPIPI